MRTTLLSACAVAALALVPLGARADDTPLPPAAGGKGMRPTPHAATTTAAPAPAPAAPAPSAPSEPGKLSLGVHEKILPNGMTVLTIERPRAPRATCWLFVKTGSVNERPGITGISHLFEHLMFKGTKKIGVKDLAADARIEAGLDEAWPALRAARASGDAKAIEAAERRFDALRAEEKKNVKVDELTETELVNGGTGANAFTDYDMTCYQVTLPSTRVELFFWLESDRLANAIFREFYSERDVVKEERRLDENRPDGPFEEELYATFFLASPYQWPILGWMTDLDEITPADLRAYFDVFYAPNNCVAVITGDVKHEETEALAARYFGPIPRGKQPPPAVRTREPKPTGERALTVVREDARPLAELLFHCPQIGHPDGPALDVAQAILSGKSGRLYDELVEKKEVALEVSAGHDEKRWEGVFSVKVYPRPSKTPEEVAEMAQAELEKLKTAPVTDEELDRARNRLEANLLRSLENNEDTTYIVGATAVVADWRLLERLPSLWRAVTAEDVKRVAAKYLVRETRTVGLMLEPEAEGKGEAGKDAKPGDEKAGEDKTSEEKK